MSMKSNTLAALLSIVILQMPFSVAFAANADQKTSTAAVLTDDNHEDMPKDLTPVYHLPGKINLISAQKTQWFQPRITVKLSYPELSGSDSNDSVKFFNQAVSQFIKTTVQDFKNAVKTAQPSMKDAPKALRSSTLTIDYNSAVINAGNQHRIVSLRFNIEKMIGPMAHPDHSIDVMNYDLKTNRILTLNELFKSDADYLNTFSSYSKEQLTKRLKDAFLTPEGTAPKSENFKFWNIKDDGILITFDVYQVAPYSYGTQTVLIPWNVLKDLISPESILAPCIKGNKCLKTQLLTGGFVEEKTYS